VKLPNRWPLSEKQKKKFKGWQLYIEPDPEQIKSYTKKGRIFYMEKIISDNGKLNPKRNLDKFRKALLKHPNWFPVFIK